MNNSLIAKSVVIAWAGYGVIIDNMIEDATKLTIYMSVPKDTIAAQSTSATGQKMCGAYLANRLQTTMNEMAENTGVKTVIMFKIRDEIWDDSKRLEAEKRAKMNLL